MWIKAFLLTQIFEMPIYFTALKGREWWKRLLIAYGASALTHPLVWWAVGRWAHVDYWTVVAGAEVFAVVAEAAFLHVHGVKRAWLWALGTNAWSFGLGLLYYDYLDPVLFGG
jgi:hypothetical protein